MSRPKPSSAANGRLSQGPKTQAGKDRSRWNSLVHGLTARKKVLLEDESEEAFEVLEESYHEDLAPQGPIENFMVDELVANDWRVRRARGIEGAILNKAINTAIEQEQSDLQPKAPVEVDLEQVLFEVIHSKPFEAIGRYQNRLSVSYHRNLTGFLRLCKANVTAPATQDPPQPVEQIIEAELAAMMSRSGDRIFEKARETMRQQCEARQNQSQGRPQTRQEVPNPVAGPDPAPKKAA